MGADRSQPTGNTLYRCVIDDVLTGTIGIHRLGQKHRQGFRRRIEAFSVPWQQLLNFLQQRVAGKQIEETIAVAALAICLHSAVLMFAGAVGNLHEDRFLLVGCGFGDLQPIMVPVFFFINRLHLSKCHSDLAPFIAS